MAKNNSGKGNSYRFKVFHECQFSRELHAQ